MFEKLELSELQMNPFDETWSTLVTYFSKERRGYS